MYVYRPSALLRQTVIIVMNWTDWEVYAVDGSGQLIERSWYDRWNDELDWIAVSSTGFRRTMEIINEKWDWLLLHNQAFVCHNNQLPFVLAHLLSQFN